MKKLAFSIFFVLQLLNTRAQPIHTVKGKIIDSKTLHPIPVVVVSISGTDTSVQTDNEGNFYLQIPSNNQTKITFTQSEYSPKTLLLELSIDYEQDLGILTLERNIQSTPKQSWISLSDSELHYDISGEETSFPLLQATPDVFQQQHAFNWRQLPFKLRGLDNTYTKTTINGIVLNKIQDGRPQWSNLGGLSTATRNQEHQTGTSSTTHTFGSLLGSQNILTRASDYPKGMRTSFSTTNSNYQWNPSITYSSGIDKKGWAYTFSGSYRAANAGYFEGTNFTAISLFIAIEKRIHPLHYLNFTGIYTPNKRAKSSALTDEIVALKGFRYNPYWGWQENHRRNSRYKEVEEPLFMLTHCYIGSKKQWTTTVAYQFGKIAHSRLAFNGTSNPDPTYYKNLPSYYASFHDRDGRFLGNTQTYQNNALRNREYFLINSQIPWNEIYRDNSSTPHSQIISFEDRTDDQTLSLHSNFLYQLTDKLEFHTAINYRKLHSENYSKLTDLLGGIRYQDVNTFFSNEQAQPDLKNPNRTIGEGEKFGYHFRLKANVLDLFLQFKYNYGKLNLQLAKNITQTNYQREGIYQNGIYPDNSLGKSKQLRFLNFGFKANATYTLSSSHLIQTGMTYANQAPHLKNVFYNMRLNNSVTPNINNENAFSFEASYLWKTPQLRGRLTTYFIEVKKASDISFYFAEGIGIVDEEGRLLDQYGDAYVSEILTGINHRNLGIEFALEYAIHKRIKATTAIALGQAFYTNNPNVQLHADRTTLTQDYGNAYLKKHQLSNTPQIATTLSLEYLHSNYWRIGLNVNYFDRTYIHISPVRRTNNFVSNPEDPYRNPFPNLTEKTIRSLLQQEKLASLLLFNANSSKSWRVQKNTMGIHASIYNLFNIIYKTAGYEQARNANYQQLLQDQIVNKAAFGNKYFYGYGRNYHLQLFYNF